VHAGNAPRSILKAIPCAAWPFPDRSLVGDHSFGPRIGGVAVCNPSIIFNTRDTPNVVVARLLPGKSEETAWPGAGQAG
jgi:hypothetical protein